MEHHKILEKWCKTFPYSVPDKSISKKAVKKAKEKYGSVKTIDSLKELARAKWNYICKLRTSGIKTGYDNINEIRKDLEKSAKHPDLGVDILEVENRKYVVIFNKEGDK